MVATQTDGSPLDQPGLSLTTLLTSIWAVSAAIWSLFTPPDKTYVARLLLFQPFWIFRIYNNDTTWRSDLIISLLLHSIYTYSTGVWTFPTIRISTFYNLDPTVVLIYAQVCVILAGCGLLAGAIVYRGHQIAENERRDKPLVEQRIDEDALLPPLLIPSWTKHSRVSPEKNSFAYSYLFVGIPIGLQGNIGSVLSVDGTSRGWFHIRSIDYLERDMDPNVGLGERLKRYLHTQGVTDREYEFAYLVTAPRFLGYSFNPVSFWYLYDSDTALRFIILEVNNTFDERRMYLLKLNKPEVTSAETSDNAGKRPLTFSDTWTKDFHVSPFNDRQGSYTLKATDPFAAWQETGEVKIDNNIILGSPEGRTTLVAHVWSTGHSKAADKITALELARFIAGSWWVGLATMPRTIYQAQKLLRKNLRIFARPEVTDLSIGRSATSTEHLLETLFHAHLRATVAHATTQPLHLIYRAAHTPPDHAAVLSAPGFTYEQDHRHTLTLTVRSPAFYSRLPHYASVSEALLAEGPDAAPSARTITFSPPDRLPVLLDAARAYADTLSRLPIARGPGPRWALLRRLRCPPAVAVNEEAAEAPAGKTDIPLQSVGERKTERRKKRFSDLDLFARAHGTDLRGPYRRAVTALFVAQRFAVAGGDLLALLLPLEVLDLLVRVVLVGVAVGFVGMGGGRWMYDVLRPELAGDGMRVRTVVGVGLVQLVHLWEVVKG